MNVFGKSSLPSAALEIGRSNICWRAASAARMRFRQATQACNECSGIILRMAESLRQLSSKWHWRRLSRFAHSQPITLQCTGDYAGRATVRDCPKQVSRKRSLECPNPRRFGITNHLGRIPKVRASENRAAPYQKSGGDSRTEMRLSKVGVDRCSTFPNPSTAARSRTLWLELRLRLIDVQDLGSVLSSMSCPLGIETTPRVQEHIVADGIFERI